MGNSNEKRFRILSRKLSYLRLEVDDKREEMSKHEAEFARKCYVSNEDASPEETTQGEPDLSDADRRTDPQENVDSQVGQVDAPVDVKRLWKQVALKTHPDRTGGDATLDDMYRRGLNAFNDGKYDELLEIASELDLKMDDVSDDMIVCLEKRADELEGELRRMKGSALWDWVSATEEKRREIEKALRDFRKTRRNVRSRRG